MNAAILNFRLTALAAVALSGAAVIGHQDCQKLDASRESLKQQIARLQTDHETLSNLVEQKRKSAPLSKEQFNELLRLRGEVGLLREQTSGLSGLQSENQHLHAAVAALSESFSDLSPADQFILRQTHTQDALSTLVDAARNYARSHDGRNPANFEQLTASGLLQVSNFPGDLTLADFEFMKPGTVDMNGRSLILRNRVPIPKPGEDPIWAYGSMDEHIGIITTPADFAKVGLHFRPYSP